MSRTATPPLVQLRWRDAHGTATAVYELHEIPHRALEVTTYGLLLRDDAEGISIASEDVGANCFRGLTFVPRPMVIDCRPVKPVRTKRALRPDPVPA